MTIPKWYFNDDLGWITTSERVQTEITAEFSNTLTRSTVTPMYYTLTISASDEFTVFYRIYPKIQDLFAEIGGFMKVIFTFLNIINLFIRVYLLDFYLMNTFLMSYPNEIQEKYVLNIDNSCSMTKSKIILFIFRNF